MDLTAKQHRQPRQTGKQELPLRQPMESVLASCNDNIKVLKFAGLLAAEICADIFPCAGAVTAARAFDNPLVSHSRFLTDHGGNQDSAMMITAQFVPFIQIIDQGWLCGHFPSGIGYRIQLG